MFYNSPHLPQMIGFRDGFQIRSTNSPPADVNAAK
jgi:hypothetical protein